MPKLSLPYHRHRCAPLAEVWPRLQAWYATEVGQALAGSERDILQSILANLFGYYLLQIGRIEASDWLSSSRVSHQIILDFPGGDNFCGHPGSSLLAEPQALPIKSDSVDVVVLPHVLEFSHYPHEVLREVERVLIPEGHLVLMVFNPWSVWGSYRWLRGWRGAAPWCGRFITTTRLRDWLALLGFEVTLVQGYFYRPPLNSGTVLRQLRLWEKTGQQLWPIFGASNVLVARKRVMTLTPIRPRWKAKAKPIVPGLVEPYQHHRNLLGKQRVQRDE